MPENEPKASGTKASPCPPFVLCDRGQNQANRPLLHILSRKREERLRKALQARERVEQLEEEKKKRMQQKTLQNDEKVRSLAKLWATQNNGVMSGSCEMERVQTGHWHNVCKHWVGAVGD